MVFSRTRVLIAGVVGGATTVFAAERWRDSCKVKASWTTHLNTPEPLYKWDPNWDRRQPVAAHKTSEAGDAPCTPELPTATRHIFLIRHGQYNLDGESDEARTLTELGREQAKKTGERLREFNYPYTKITYSTMTRAQETGAVISSLLPEGVPVEHCALLREGAPIPPEPPVGGWRPEAQQFFRDGARIEAAFRKHIHRADVKQKETSHEIIVCHANVIRYFVCRALQLPPEAWLRMSLHHGSITWLTVRPSGNVSMRALGDCGFMGQQQLTTS